MSGLSRRLAILCCLFTALPALAADGVDLVLALPRTQYRAGEPVEVAVLYTNDGGNITKVPLEVQHADGSIVTFEVPFDAAPGKSQTRIVPIGSGVLKPGRYTATARAGAAEKSVTFALHLYRGTPGPFWVGQWVHQGESRGTTLAKGGWMYLTGDLATLHPRRPKPGDLAEWYVEAGTSPYARMVLGGGHQLDLDLHNDWGDPWVQRTIVWRMQLAALSNRIYPIAGLHCFDEPGLTWWPLTDDKGKVIETNPFAIPHQLEEFTKLTGKKMPVGKFADTGPKYAGMMDDWLAFTDMRMKYLEQAWYATVWGTLSVAPFQTINQVSSSYSPGNTTDGVDSRQARPYRIVSGHGGYSDLPFGTMQPVRSAEAFQGLTRERPHYFLPMWYTHTWASMRNAVWMAWTTKLEGLLYTPEQDFGLDNSGRGYDGTHTVFEIAEINRRLGLVGDVLWQIRKTPAPVAVLHSHRQYAHDLATFNTPELHKPGSPQYFSPHHNAVDTCFFRVLEQGVAPNWIDEVEAAEGGANFLKQWKVILCPRLASAAPALREALEKYAAAGGKLVQFKGDKLILEGSIVADHDFGDPGQYYAEKVQNDGNILSPNYRDLAWRKWNNDLAPTFAKDLAAWVGPREFECANKEILLGVHKATGATYLLFANNAQSKDNPRALKHELIPAETEVRVPAGVVYDVFNGGKVPVTDGKARLRLAAGDGACWVHLPEAPGVLKLTLKEMRWGAQFPHGIMVAAVVDWPRAGDLPCRLRVYDPSGQLWREEVRAVRASGNGVGPARGAALFSLGENAARGAWKVEVHEWLTGTKTVEEITIGGNDISPHATTDSRVTFLSGDDGRIRNLVVGKASQPDYTQLNWDARRVFGLNPNRFAVFGPDGPAARLADALKARGLTVEVNPKYEIKPFVRQPGRGGAGVTLGVNSNLENIYAHTIVLPGHPLLARSQERGHINREVTAAFPGPGRAFIQWGIGCYQPCWENVFVQGDLDAGMDWLLSVISEKGKREGKSIALKAALKTAPAKKAEYPAKLAVAGAIKLDDTPVGVGAAPDGKILYTLCHDGRVMAHDRDGKQLWHSRALLEGCALAVSPKGDRLAAAGYPGLLVLDTRDGKVLGGFRAEPVKRAEGLGINRMVCAAWNDAGTLAAGGWLNPDAKSALDPVVLDAGGKVVSRPKGIAGGVMGAAFVPKGDTLLLGADQLTAVKAADGSVLWRNALKGGQAFAFGADGKTAAAGGWGKNAGVFGLADGVLAQTAVFDSVIGGVALLPDGALAVAVWGGVHPLYVLRDGKTGTLFESSFGFQNVVYSARHQGLIAAEQGGKLWLLDGKGTPKALLDEDAGTTAYRLQLHGDEVLLARMNRVVQRVTVGAGR